MAIGPPNITPKVKRIADNIETSAQFLPTVATMRHSVPMHKGKYQGSRDHNYCMIEAALDRTKSRNCVEVTVEYGAKIGMHPNADAIEAANGCTKPHKRIENHAASHNKHCGRQLVHIRSNTSHGFRHSKEKNRQKGCSGGLPACVSDIKSETHPCPAAARVRIT